MDFRVKHLTPNEWSRPKRLFEPGEPRFVVLHWTANPGQGWRGVWDWFESAPERMKYGSTHAVADDRTVVEMIPSEEIAYHVGSRSYTKFAHTAFPAHMLSNRASPNAACLGIEMCVEDYEGSVTDMTWWSTVEWCATICRDRGWDPHQKIITHQHIVGWKQCPRWMVNNPDELERFRNDVRREL